MFTFNERDTQQSYVTNLDSRQPSLNQLTPALAKKRREHALRFKRQATSEKYFPAEFRSNTHHSSNDATNHSVLLTPERHSTKLSSNGKVVPFEQPPRLCVPSPLNLKSPSHQDLEIAAMRAAANLRTSSNKEIEDKRKVGAASSSVNRFILHPIGTSPLYQTETFTYRQRTKFMVATGLCVVSLMIIFVGVLAVMGYSG